MEESEKYGSSADEQWNKILKIVANIGECLNGLTVSEAEVALDHVRHELHGNSRVVFPNRE